MERYKKQDDEGGAFFMNKVQESIEKNIISQVNMERNADICVIYSCILCFCAGIFYRSKEGGSDHAG